MKRYDPSRADSRTTPQKAFGIIMAMNYEDAAKLQDMLHKQSQLYESKRAAQFLGTPYIELKKNHGERHD